MCMLGFSVEDSTSIPDSSDAGSEPSSNEGERTSVETVEILSFEVAGMLVLMNTGVRVATEFNVTGAQKYSVKRAVVKSSWGNLSC